MFTPKQTHGILSTVGYKGPPDTKAMELFAQSSEAARAKLGRFESAAKKIMEKPEPLMAMDEGGSSENRGNTVPDWIIPPPADAIVTQAAVQLTHPITGETVMVPTGGYSLNMDVINASNKDGAELDIPSNEGFGDSGYDPSDGSLPTAPKPDYSTVDLSGITYNSDLQEGIDLLVSSGKLPDDPTKFTVEGESNNWTVTFDNGLKIPFKDYNKASSVTNLINTNFVPIVSKLKESPETATYNDKLSQYSKDLKSYQDYTLNQASEKVSKPDIQVDTLNTQLATQQTVLTNYQQKLGSLPVGDPQREVIEKLITDQQTSISNTTADLQNAVNAYNLANPTALQEATDDVSSTFQAPEATTVGETTVDDTTIGDISGEAPSTSIAEDDNVKMTQDGAGTTDPGAYQIGDDVGKISDDVSQVVAETGTESTADMANVEDVETYTADTSKSDVDAELSKLQAQQGTLTSAATVRGQMDLLMQDFDEGTPPWASGALREATQAMAARGLGASSMAGQAIVTAAMESALPIAAADAKTQAQMEFKNLDNRQATAIFKTQQRIATILSDTAMTNAAKQFNAQSTNQVNMFKSEMQTQVNQFNASQINSMVQFNAGQENAISQFNANLKEQREQFNAKNDVIIQQANVQFRNDMFQTKLRIQTERDISQAQITSAEGIAERRIQADKTMAQSRIDAEAAANQARINAEAAAAQAQITAAANLKEAELAHDATQKQLAREQQAEQDALTRMANQEEGNKNRALTLLTTTMAAETQVAMAEMAESSAEKAGIGALIGTAIGLNV